MEIKKTVDMKGGILVGHDGSRFSDHAVSWALKLAVRLSYDVTVVRAWVLTTAPRPETWSPGYVPPLADFADATRKALEADVAPLLRDFPTVNVSCQAVHGLARNVDGGEVPQKRGDIGLQRLARSVGEVGKRRNVARTPGFGSRRGRQHPGAHDRDVVGQPDRKL